MADTKLSALALATQVDRIYGETAAVSKAVTPADVRGPRLTKTANYTVVAGDAGTHFNNVGAAGTVVFTLPAAADGLSFLFVCCVAQTLRVTAVGADKIAIGPDNSAAAGNVASSEPFDVIAIEAHGANQWVATFITGTWTVT